MNNYQQTHEQLQLLQVKEGEAKPVPAKRVNIVSLRMMEESSLLYKVAAFVVQKMVTIY